jgi:hypothetical protein
MRMKARKLQSAKGAGRTNKLTKLVHELYFPSQLLMLEIPNCEPLGVLNCQTKCWFLTYPVAAGENVSWIERW